MARKAQKQQNTITYMLIAAFSEELDCSHVTFSAIDQDDADRKAVEWNRYHGKTNRPGYGWQKAIQSPSGVAPRYDSFFS